MILRTLFVLAILVLVPATPRPAAAQGSGSATAAARQTRWTVPRTPWGHPDLQGIWTTQTLTPLERPVEFGDRAFLTSEEAEAVARKAAAAVRDESQNRRANDPGTYNSFWLENGTAVDPSRRTGLITDPPSGRIPWKPEMLAENQRARQTPATYDSWTDLDTGERCLTDGPTSVDSQGYNMNFQIIQTPDHVVIAHEMFHQYVIVPLDGRPRLPQGIGLWLGDARGRWDGDTLVVETQNFADKFSNKIGYRWGNGIWRASRPSLKLIERFRRVSDDRIDYQFTVDDPTMFSRPWTAAPSMLKTTGPIFEYACHEGNHAVVNTLKGARSNERQEPARQK
jgi:hypothetical protein